MASLLLINSNQFKHPWPVLPFGLCCVAAAVEHAGHSVKLLDLCFSRHCRKDIERAVQKFKPDVIGIGIRNIDNAVGFKTQFLLDDVRRQVVSECRRLFAGPIVIGGAAVAVNAEEMLSFLDLEYAIQGDGELAMVEFLRRFEDKSPLEGLAGLVIRRSGKITQNLPPLITGCLDSLPRPKPHRYLDLQPYRRFNVALPIQSKRGCALKCSYCSYNRIEGRSYRLRDPQKIADEIAGLLLETGINRFEFTDSTFNIPLNHAKAVLRAVIAKGLALDLRTMGLNPAAVDEELADLMLAAGFTEVDLGAEAGSDIVLNNLGKGFSAADIVQAGKLLRERNIPITWYLMLGAPVETKETLAETFAVITEAASSWDLINIGVGIRVYNGSPLADQLKSEDNFRARDNFFAPVHIEPARLSLKQVKAIAKLESFRQPNFFLYDEDEDLPLFMMRTVFFLTRWLAPKQPVWRFHIFMRKLQKSTGISALKCLSFRLASSFRQPGAASTACAKEGVEACVSEEMLPDCAPISRAALGGSCGFHDNSSDSADQRR